MSWGHHDSILSLSTPAAPPPPYTEFAAGPSSSTLIGPFSGSQPTGPLSPRLQHHQPMPIPSGPPHLAMQVHHPGYGPTPLASNQPLLPYAYYEARGSADARARSRFIAAFLCAFGLWLLVAFAVGVEVVGEKEWFRGYCVKRFWVLDGIVRYWLWTRISDGAVEFAVV